MFEDMTIMIPTLGRVNKQVTLEHLSLELLDRTVLVVDEDEALDHGHEVLVLPPDVNGIHNVRQWCVDNCKTPYLFLIDDDMKFFKRITKGQPQLEKCTDGELEQMFITMMDWLEFDETPVVGLSARQGNNHVKEDSVIATRQMNFHGVDIHRFNELGLRFDFQAVMEDFHMTLKLLTQGIPNRVMYDYCWNQTGSGANGGCSSYRTWEVQKQAAENLNRTFPDFVTVVTKKTKTVWKEFGERYDVRVQWKKAYEFGLEKSL